MDATVQAPGSGVAPSPRRHAAPRAGFTAIEMLIVMVMIGIMGAMLVPQVSRYTAKSSVGRAVAVVSSDLERAFTQAARLRKPVILSADNGAHTYQVTNAATGAVLFSRSLKLGQEPGVETMTFSSTSITIQANGVASDSLGVTLVARGSTRHISMSVVGLIRRTQ